MPRFEQAVVSSALARASLLEQCLRRDFVCCSGELGAASQRLKQAGVYLTAIRDQRYSERDAFLAAEREQLYLKIAYKTQLEDLFYAVEAQRLRLDEISNFYYALARGRRALSVGLIESVESTKSAGAANAANLPILQQKLEYIKLEVLYAKECQVNLRDSLLRQRAASAQARKQLQSMQLVFSLLVLVMGARFLAR